MNAAFSALPDGTVDTLLKPENKDALVNVLTYHVVPGRWTYSELKAAVKRARAWKPSSRPPMVNGSPPR